MQKLVTADTIRALEEYVIQQMGIPSLVLMEKAALSVCGVIRKEYANAKRILIVCGTGNNGADGLAVARMLSVYNQLNVDVLMQDDTHRGSTEYEEQKKWISNYPITVYREWTRLSDTYDLIVDAIFGFGLNRDINGVYASWIRWINDSKASVVSVDMPSGIHADSGQVLGCAIRADITVTFSYVKLGMIRNPGAVFAGEVKVCSLDFPPAIWDLAKVEPVAQCHTPEDRPKLPKRPLDGHKGTFGKVTVIGGFDNMPGAALMAGMAALKSGAGMLRIISTQENRDLILQTLPEAQFGNIEEAGRYWNWPDVIVIGPGMGQKENAVRILEECLDNFRGILILDADALNLLANRELGLWKKLSANLEQYRGIVLTPHPGEYRRLQEIGIDNFLDEERKQTKFHMILVKKDARTEVIYGKMPIYINTSGNHGMGTGGSGDVLSGMIAGLTAQSKEHIYDTVLTAVYLHGLCGDMYLTEHDAYTLTATSLIERLQDGIRLLSDIE